MQAMVFAVGYVNDDPHLLPNVTVAFTIRDSCSNPSHALQQAFHFVQDLGSNGTCAYTNGNDRVAVSGVVGGIYSSVSIDIAHLLRLYKVPQISPKSTSDILSDKVRFDYFFRTIPPNSLQARAIADIIVTFNWTYVFLLHSDDTYGKGGTEILMAELQDRGISVAAVIPLPETNYAMEYDRAVSEMSSEWVRNASVAVLFGHKKNAAGMMEALMRFRKSSDGFKLKKLT